MTQILPVRVNKNDFIHIILTEGQLEKVNEKTNQTMMSDHNMHLIDVYSSKMSEVSVSDYFGIELADTYDYDMILQNGKTVDIKSKKVVTNNPYPDHYNEVYRDNQKTDYYLFCQVAPERKSVWILGYISKSEFFDLATFKLSFQYAVPLLKT